MTGYLYGILTAACWATSPIFIREGLRGLPSPLWGVTVGLTASTALYVAWVMLRDPAGVSRVAHWSSLDGGPRAAVCLMLLGGAVSGVGAVARTVALDLAPVAVVIPLTQTASLWTVLFAPIFLGRHVERVTLRLVLGVLLLLAGCTLVILGQSL